MAELGIIDVALAENVAVAYREFRHIQHRLKSVSYTHLDVYKRQALF